MDILYVTNARIPTEKAHGFAIISMCRAFMNQGHSIRLVVPIRRTHIPDQLRAWYGARPVPTTKLPTLDAVSISSAPGKIAFLIQAGTFYASLAIYLLLRRRVPIYTRDIAVVVMRLLGYPVCVEVHAVPHGSVGSILCRQASAIVTIAEAARDTLISNGIPADNVKVVPSGVDMSLFDIQLTKESARLELDIPGNEFLAVYTGSFTTFGEEKGLTDCIEAVARTPDCRFVAVGGSDEDVIRYRSLATMLAVDDRVSLIGREDQSTLARYQKAADVLLAPFPDTEHYRTNMSPMKILEYAASGRPIIATDLPTIRTIFAENEIFYVSPGAPDEIAHTMRVLQNDPSIGTARSAKAHERVAREYSWNHRAEVISSYVRSRLHH